ncbi:UvrB/UvrC motif-containing protein [Telmatocola sphagniphila]|jgi:protein arginine kinase activator|uniref:UvrB/UvrC motif-containing protein n=1 Tax=Telmatocola sphagniphila TaxID=1123043 RepID=A0A8E6B1A2_9BACT|nr:UvrB/UvrC motif-containing protein [Telmatocola sphagniphila]QVL29892.1 UvrB/UvrC motif-containing protein [Telmatocola sphagniphila]
MCVKTASLHITEILENKSYKVFNLCEDCAQQFFQNPGKKTLSADPEDLNEAELDEALLINQRQCEVCGIKFVEFRNTGRLGCPHDYEAFRTELLPLLESIHGKNRHSGKTPRRLPTLKDAQQELSKLRKQLHRAIEEEAYEEAAGLRDRIKELENT